jgi:NAD(P)-dependent dehydrogenase (short-subunit alcohol dehydrogenase family)
MTETSAPVAVVTGATSGIGRVTALELARAGWTVLCVGRDAGRGAETLAEIRAAAGDRRAEFLQADLSSIAAGKALGAIIRDRRPRLDLLVNNAGTLFDRRQESVDGLEMTFALNHLGYFVLTDMLLPALAAAPSARIVNVASGAHRRASLDFTDLQMRQRYSGWQAYARSKLANILFTRELARRLAGGTVTANCLHPGFVASRFGSGNGPLWRAAFRTAQIFAISPAESAKAVLHLALAPELAGTSGAYFDRDRPGQSSPAAEDLGAARELWAVSAELTGLGA